MVQHTDFVPNIEVLEINVSFNWNKRLFFAGRTAVFLVFLFSFCWAQAKYTLFSVSCVRVGDISSYSASAPGGGTRAAGKWHLVRQ